MRVANEKLVAIAPIRCLDAPEIKSARPESDAVEPRTDNLQ